MSSKPNAEGEKCLLCGSPSQLLEKDFPGYIEGQKFEIWHCKSCDTSFSLPRTGNADRIYDLIYNNIKEIPNYFRYLNYSDCVLLESNPLKFLCEQGQSYWGIRKGLFNILKVGQGTQILEIGCGLGYLTYALNKAGLSVTGVDISENAIKDATARFGNYYVCRSLNELVKLVPGKYDIIIMSELIEHLNDITSFFSEAVRLIKPDGEIIITTPDKSHFSKKFSWCTDLPPVHSWWLSEKSIRSLGSGLGMKVRFVRFRSFYHTRPGIIRLDTLDPEKSTFDIEGNLILKGTDNKGIAKKTILGGTLRKVAGDIIYFRIRKVYYSMLPGYVVFGKRGFSICAILYR